MSFFKKILSKIPFFNNADTEPKDSELGSETNAGTAIAELEKGESLERIKVNKSDLEDLEEELIRADLGVDLAMDFIANLRKDLKSEKEIYRDELSSKLKSFLLSAFDEMKESSSSIFALELKPAAINILMILGVNGVGKTTSIAKLAHKYKNIEGKKVLIAAGDTFRAAAEEQLRTWAERTGADLIEMPHGSKSSAVVYKAIEKAKNEGYDLVLIDTAGRLHNKKNLMEELAKIQDVIKKNLADKDYKLETMLVLDASMGQNSSIQAETFNELCKVDSIILTKFDGSSKAGTVFSIAHKLKIPVKFLGTGEKMENLEEFSPETFTNKYF